MGSTDINRHQSLPTPDPKVRRGGFVDDHGTPAGGLAAGVRNDAGDAHANTRAFCGVGAGYGAKLAGIRILGDDTHDQDEADGIAYMPDKNDIYSNSWGPCDQCRLIEGPGPIAKAHVETAMHMGRGGRGVIYVWAAGNGRSIGDNCNNDGWASWRYMVTIAGTTSRGKQSSFSEECSALTVAVPAGGSGPSLTTTDLQGSGGQNSGDCMSGFSGTSAAAPVAAGVVSLVLQAKPELTWRDVQAVLIQSAVQVDKSDSRWQKNGAGLHYSHAYGFGLLDAGGAVTLAKSWTNWPPAQVYSSPALSLSVRVEPNNKRAETTTLAADAFPGAAGSAPFTEHVEIYVNMMTQKRGALSLTLTSPSGTKSYLVVPNSDTKAGPPANWRYTTNANWGESPIGSWKLVAEMDKHGHELMWIDWKIVVYYH